MSWKRPWGLLIAEILFYAVLSGFLIALILAFI